MLGLLDPAVLERFDVIAPDLRAHGSNAMAIDADLLTFRQLAADVIALLDELDLDEPPVLIGVSMGAAIALQLQGDQPRFSHVALIRPAWAWTPRPANLEVFDTIARLLSDGPPSEARIRFVESPAYARIAAVSPAAAQALLTQIDEEMATERRERLTCLPADAPARPTATAPITILANETDPLHPMDLAEQLAGDLGADLDVIAPRYDAPDQHVADLSASLLRL
jgi:pimeloyl-ACP methyl ester carboxylesterase